MGIFDEIAAAIGADGSKQNICGKTDIAIESAVNLSSTNKEFIEWSAEYPKKKTDPENPGNTPNEDNYYWTGRFSNNHLVAEDMEKFNRNWAKDRLANLKSKCFTHLFYKKLWTAIKQTAADQATKQALHDPEDLFYFFAFALQRILDPKHKKMGFAISDANSPDGTRDGLGNDPNDPIDRLIYEPFRLMVPDVFDGHVNEGSKNGTYAGFYGLGNTSITIEDQSSGDLTTVLSKYQFDLEETIESWYDLFDNHWYSEDPGASPPINGLLKDELKKLKAVQNIFTLDMIYALKKDIEDNEQAYENYESTYIQSTHFSLKGLGPGVWHFDANTTDTPGAGLAYQWARQFWDDFIELYIAASGDTSAVEDLEQESIEQADLFSFDPDQCGIPETIVVEEDLCPPLCVPKDCEPVDWTTSPNEIVFLSEGTCEYWAPITTTYSNLAGKDIDTIMDEYVSPGIKLILDSLGKESSETSIQSLIPEVTTDYYVDFRNLAKIKVLVKLPFDIILEVDDKPPNPPEDSGDFPLNVVLIAADIRGRGSMFNLVSRAIGKKYAVQVEIETYKGQFSGLPKGTLLKTEADRLKEFKKALIDLLKEQNFKFNPTRKKNGVLEAVEIAFKEGYEGIEYIKANNFGCEAVDLKDGRGWDAFLKNSVTKYPTTLAFVANIPSIYDSVTSDTPPAVDLFMKTYYFPPIEEDIGQELTMIQEFIDENGCNTTELVASLTRPALILGSEVAGTVLSFPELFSAALGEKTCLTLEGKAKQDERYNALDDLQKRWKDVELRKLFSGDAVFEDLPRKLKEVENLDQLYREILNKLGVCGLAALVFDALDCIIKGLDINTSMAMLVKSFIKNATDKEMESVFFAFHPGLRQLIRDSVAEITSIPLPWEAGYRPGSYQAAGVKYSADYITGASGSLEERLEKTPDSSGDTPEGNLKRFRSKSKTTIEEQKEKFRSFANIPVTDANGERVLDDDGNQIIISSPEGVMPAPGLGPRSYAGPFAHAGSVGTALDNIQDNIVDILKEAIIDAIENNIISGEALIGFIDKIPGAALLKDTITGVLDCPMPPLFSPPLDDILKTLELDFCAGHYAITLPVIPKFPVRPFLGDIKTILIEAFEDALEALIAKAITLIISKILKVILNASCESLGDIAGILKDITGGSDFRSVVANNLCGDSLNTGELNGALNKLNDSLGSLGLPGVPKPTDDDMGEFMDGISVILTQQELLDFLDGNPSDQTVAYARQVVNGIQGLAAVLTTDEDIRNLFVGLGRVFDRDALRDKIAASSFKPICPAICASLEDLERFDDLRCEILKEKGLTDAECEDQLNKLKERALCDFDALANVLNENYFGEIDANGNPLCPEDGLLPREDPETKKLTQELFDSNYDVINSTLLTELVTKKGLLNMILSDVDGRGLKRHNAFSENSSFVNFLTPTVSDDDYPLDVAPYLRDILDGTSTDSPLDVNYMNDADPNLTLKFINWDIDSDGIVGLFGDPKDSEINFDYNYQKDDDTKINIKIYSEGDQFGPPIEFDAVHSYNVATPGVRGSTIADKIDDIGASTPTSIDKPADMPNQAYIFGKLVASSLSKYSPGAAVATDAIADSFSTTIFQYLTNKIIEKFALKISQNVRTFSYGWDASASATIVELDWEIYGGTEDNPAFYVKPPVYGGWLGLYDKIVPGDDVCARESIINFNSISEQTGEYNDKLKDDPRLQFPAACVVDSERPFDRAMPRASLAGTDGAIMATVRLYVVEAFLKGLPSFSLFSPKFPDVYDDTLLGYIAAKMKEGLLDTGLNFRKPVSKEKYYYTFLEEVVQNFGKKVDIGEILPTHVQLDAMEEINRVQATYDAAKAPGKKSKKKRIENYKLAYIRTLEPECLILLNHYIAQQLVEVGKLFSDTLKPSIPNLESWVFGSSTWMALGSIADANGPMDVATDPTNNGDDTTSDILNMPTANSIPAVGKDYGEGFFPFILEKYIIVNPRDDFLGEDPSPQIFGLQWWKEYLDTGEGSAHTGAPIIDNYLQWSYGLRLSIVIPGFAAQSFADLDEQITPEDVQTFKSLKFGDDNLGPNGKKYVIPIAVAEVPISDSKILDSTLIDQYDLNCMISELIGTPEYKTLFKYCFPLQSLLSFVTIYVIETFLLSIGEEWPTTTLKLPFQSQFRKWDKTGNFKKTKKNLRRLFEGYYNSRDATYEDEEEETNEEKTRKRLKVKRNLPDSNDIKWWKKRLQVPKPAEECD
jgi:hypothetical protein